ncbi:hypothetical protein SAMN05661008_00010 [Alkalithermobacter thermoalcaliphilus JW-YL-7 = DSM 7308]|uniref:Uncharacterized protein n=1 Tax=Alkalithermobacter thermoalcaliphilus JW-YL-7 = DSM 7308 TaxID=1121328 RepID=A0A150FS56_CLOPD|nr:hypothetical protein JWYL7_1509 [[Clostridium] paradoxum JW-YL-7 = DSM 7308]SHK32529.1 hypothetical protein SAMN05661008_00010 [[Clostridium] paradoxum JW-YL-7 = DSM 7308]
MNKVLQYIENYGFKIHKLKDESIHGYHCINNLSNSEFILVCVGDDLKIKQLDDLSNKVVYLICLNDNIDKVIDIVESDKHQDKTFLIYDEQDEIEFFLKDLWNVIVDLNK